MQRAQLAGHVGPTVGLIVIYESMPIGLPVRLHLRAYSWHYRTPSAASAGHRVIPLNPLVVLVVRLAAAGHRC